MTLKVGIRRLTVAAAAAATLITAARHRPRRHGRAQHHRRPVRGCGSHVRRSVPPVAGPHGPGGERHRSPGRRDLVAARPAVRRRLLPGLPRRPVPAVRQGGSRELHRAGHQLDGDRPHGAHGARRQPRPHPERDPHEGRRRGRQGRRLAAASSRTPTAAGPTTRGGASDANSTGLSLSGILTQAPSTDIPAYRKASRFLGTVSGTCADGGGLAYQAGSKVDGSATAQGLIGLVGPMPVSGPRQLAVGARCANTSKAKAVSYLARALAPTGALPSSLGSGADYSNTATAVLGLVAAGQGRAAVAKATTTLKANATAFVTGDGTSPGAAGLLLMVAEATAGSRPPSAASTWCARSTRRSASSPAMTRTTVRAAAALAAAVMAAVLVSAPAQAAAYRYWTYWQAPVGAAAWAFATQGPGTSVPADGDVEGWSFAVSTESANADDAPATDPRLRCHLRRHAGAARQQAGRARHRPRFGGPGARRRDAAGSGHVRASSSSPTPPATTCCAPRRRCAPRTA